MKTTTTLGNARPLLLALCLWLLCAGSARSQEFTVSSFRLLPNDVSAFVNSVRDLNDEACALVKVEAPSDFAFSTPLGIVKRKAPTIKSVLIRAIIKDINSIQPMVPFLIFP